MNARSLLSRLRAVWDKSPDDMEKSRYVPKEIGDGTDWAIFDRGQERFLTAEEIAKLTPKMLATERFLN